jgi:hypothetical protein
MRTFLTGGPGPEPIAAKAGATGLDTAFSATVYLAASNGLIKALPSDRAFEQDEAVAIRKNRIRPISSSLRRQPPLA